LATLRRRSAAKSENLRGDRELSSTPTIASVDPKMVEVITKTSMLIPG
jgi:hypothetical protein